MNEPEVLETINEIKGNNNLSLKQKEDKLHDIERRNRDVFIKTDICPHCNHLTVDVWFKHERFSIEGEEMKEPKYKHRPPKKNFGTMEENIDENGEFNP